MYLIFILIQNCPFVFNVKRPLIRTITFKNSSTKSRKLELINNLIDLSIMVSDIHINRLDRLIDLIQGHIVVHTLLQLSLLCLLEGPQVGQFPLNIALELLDLLVLVLQVRVHINVKHIALRCALSLRLLFDLKLELLEVVELRQQISFQRRTIIS